MSILNGESVFMINRAEGQTMIGRWKYVASLLSTCVAGYLSLATSCGGSLHTSEPVETSVHFEADQDFALVRIRWEGESIQVDFDQHVEVPVNFQQQDGESAPEDGDIVIPMSVGGAGGSGQGPGMSTPGDPSITPAHPSLMVPIVEDDPPGRCDYSRLTDPFVSGLPVSCTFFPADDFRGEGEVELRVFRGLLTASFDLEVKAVVRAEGSCDGDPPSRMAITIEEVEP
jgi:hypothetical protein